MAAFRQAGVTLLTAAVIGAVTVTFGAVTGHATDDDLKRVELESKERDDGLSDRIDAAAKKAAEERIKQAVFRTKVAAKLEIELDK